MHETRFGTAGFGTVIPVKATRDPRLRTRGQVRRFTRAVPARGFRASRDPERLKERLATDEVRGDRVVPHERSAHRSTTRGQERAAT